MDSKQKLGVWIPLVVEEAVSVLVVNELSWGAGLDLLDSGAGKNDCG